MELELGLKITKTRDDISSISEYQLAKDKGPVFQSRETNTTFILTAHLKGYKRNNIDIKISKDGNKITISGEKPIQEMVMIGWVMHKKVVDVTGFNKVFKIPNGVNLDRIKAKYDEDEWILSIVMPKLVKGICGLRIEEVKEEFDKRISEKEKSETDHVSSSVGETSQRGSKDNVQDIESRENIMQKLVGDDANKEMNEEIKKVGDGIGDGNGEGMREKVGKQEYEEMKTSVEKNDTSQDKESEDIKGSTVEKEETKLRNEDDKLKGRIMEEEEQNLGACGTQTTRVTSQGVSEECSDQQSGESKQKFGESKCENDERLEENMKESSKMVSKADGQKELEESRIQQKEKTKGTKGKIDGGKHEKTPNEANKDVEKTILGDIIKKDNIKPSTENDNEDQECVAEKPVKEEGSVAMVAIRDQFPKTTLEESEELRIQKMQEIKDVKEEMIKRKKKEIQYFKEKGEGERQKTVHVDANKDTREEIEADNEKRKNGIEGSSQHVGENTVKGRFELPKTITEALPKKLVELDESKGFKVENVEEQEKMIKEGKAEIESLMENEEGEESEKRNEEANKVLDDSNKEMNEERIKKGIGESKMGIGDENGKGMRKRVGKEVNEVMKSSEKEKNVGVCMPQRIEDTTSQDKDTEVQKMESRSVDKKNGRVFDKVLDDGNGDQTGSTIKNGREKSKLRIEDGNVKGVGEKIGKATYEAMKASEIEQDVGAGFTQNNRDTKQMEEKGSRENFIEEKTEVVEKTKFGIDKGGRQIVKEKVGKEACEAKKSSELEQKLGACTTQNSGIKSQGVSEDSLIQQIGKPKEKEFGEPKCEFENRLKENMKKRSIEPFEAMKGSELDDQNVVDQQMEKSKRTKGKIDGEKYKNTPVEAKKDVEKTILGDIIQKGIIKPKIETENAYKECVREKPGKEGSDAITAIREEFPKHLPKTTLEEAEAMNIKKMQEIQDVKEEMIERKGNEIECSVEKGEGERNKTMHDANKGITRETVEKEIEKKENGVELPKSITEEFLKKLVELDRSKGFKVAEEEEQKEMIKVEKVETQSLMKKAEGEYSNKRNEETDKVLDDANKDMSEERIKKKVGEFKLGIGDGNGKGVRRKVGKEEHEVMKTLKLEKNAGVCIPQRIEDTTSQDKEPEVQKMDNAEKEGRVLDKMIVDGNRDQTGSTIKKGREESKLWIEDGKMKGKKEKTGKATYEATKTSEIKQDVGVGFPQNIGDISQDKEFEDQKMDEKGSVAEKEKVETDNMFHDTNEKITEEIEKAKFGIEEVGGKSGKEKVGNKGCEEMKSSEHQEGLLEVPNSITKELPKKLEELDGCKESKSAKEEEQKEVTEEATAETKILMEKMEDSKRNDEASRDTAKTRVIETFLKKTEESNIEKKSSDGQIVHGKLPKQVVEASFQDEKNKTEHGIVKLKEKGSTKMHVEPNEAFENDTTGNRIEKEIRKQKLESSDQLSVKENVNNEIFDGRKRQKFPGMEEPEYAKDDGTKKGYVKKVTRDKYENIHVQANEDLKKDITKETRGGEIKDRKIQTKEKGEHHLHEEMSKERSQQSKAAKELNIREKFPKHLPKTTLKESEELTVQKMQEIKDVREEMIKRKGKDTEHFVEKGEGERHKPMHVDANKGIKREIIEDDIEKRKNGIDQSGQQYLEKNTVKGRFELPGSMTEELMKKLVELDGSKGLKIAEEEEEQEMIKAEKDKTECFMDREEGEESKKINEVVDKVLDDANMKIKEEEVGESKMGIGDGNEKGVRKKVGKEEHEEMDTLELEKIVGECIPQRIQDTTSKDKKSKVPKMDSRSVEKKDGKEQFPKHLPKATLEESEESNVQTTQEIKDVKEEMIKRKGKKIEYSEEKAEGEKHKTMDVEENKGTTRETMQENIEKKKIRVDESGQHVGENIVKGVFEVPKSITEEPPKQLEELDGSKEVKVAKEVEQKEVSKEAMDETEILMEKNGEESKRNEEASSGTEKSRVIETLLKKPEESNIEKKSSDGPLIKEKLPKKMVEEIAEAEKDKTEHGIVKLKGKGSIKMHVEPIEAFENDTAGKRIEKNARKQKHEYSDQATVKEIVNNEIFDGIKRQNFPKNEEHENSKEEGAKIERSVKKVNGDKYEKIQVEVNEDYKKEITEETKEKEIEDPNIQTKEKGEHHLHEEMSKEISQESKSARNDPFTDTVQEEKEEPKILNKVKDQQCLQEDMSKGRYVASITAREFPTQIVDSLAKTRERPKNKETEEAKGGLAKRKSEEIKVVESRTKEKLQGTESEKTTQILHEAPEEKHPKAFEIGTPERELQSERGHTTSAKAVILGFNKAEQGRAKDKKQNTKLLPPKTPSKETHGSEDESVNQHDFKPKQTKEVGKQPNFNTEGTKEVAAKEDQKIKPSFSPWFPSTQQSEVKEKDKFYEGGKAKHEVSREPQKKDLTKDMQNFIEKENQEGKQKEALRPEIPLEKHPKKGEPVIRRGEFHKGENVGEKMQEKTDGPKKKIDVRNQQYVAIDVGKVKSIEEEMSKEYKADAGSIAERMETKKGLKTTHEREDDMQTQNVDDEKPKIQDEIIKADIEKVNKDKCILESMKTTQEKEHPIKSEAVVKETESSEAASSLPNVTSMGVKEESPKKEIEDLHQKKLSPLKAEIKSKEPPLELEKPVIQWKRPKTKEHVSLTELRDKEQLSYFTEEIEEQKITAYEGAKQSKLQRQIITQQSTDEGNRKPQNDVEEHKASKESPKISIGKTEQIDSFQPQVFENEYFEENQFNEQDEILDQCEFQGQKILNEDRGQQHVQDNNDNKGSQTPKGVEEEMFMKEREESKVAKSGEAKDSSRNKRERGKTSHFPEAKKSKMKEKTSHFEKASGSKQVADKMHESMDYETPNKEVERKEPHEITWPNMDYETPQIPEVEEEKEGERHAHALVQNISKEELAQATATHSNTKSEVEPKGDNDIDKPQVNQLPSPSIEMLSKEPQESEVSEKKEPIHSTEGITASEEVSVKEESQEAKKEDFKTDVQEPNKGKRDQKCINKDEEEKYGINEIEEEKASEEGLEEQKEYKEEASGGKKDDTIMPKKLIVPLVIAGSALLGGIFVWHRRTRKR